MSKFSIIALTLAAAAIAAPAVAQTAAPAPAAAPAAATNDPVVQQRAEKRAVNDTFVKGVMAARADRQAKVTAAVEEAMKTTDESKDPLVIKRDAETKAEKATKAEHDAKVKALVADRKAAMAAIDKKYKAADKAAAKSASKAASS